jgi:Fe-S-cluster containining protein
MALPPLFERWLTELHGAAPPEQPRTTCSSCPMIKDLLADHQFTRETKCCTFFPDMASFLVGGVLLDEHPGMAEGRRRLGERIAMGQQVTPLGVSRPQIFLKLYGVGETFGKQPALRCPYYIAEGGQCGVWRHRESTCATWFCKYEHGTLGFQFWTAQHRLLKAVERGVATTVALDLGIEEEALDLLLSTRETIDRERDAEIYRAVWEPWLGREHEYYEETARRVAAMSWADVLERAKGQLEERVVDARATWEQLQSPPPMPDLVRIRPLRRAGGDGRRVLLKSYSDYDPLEVTAETAAALEAIDGRPVEVIVEELRERGVDRDFLQHLWERGMLEGPAR